MDGRACEWSKALFQFVAIKINSEIRLERKLTDFVGLDGLNCSACFIMLYFISAGAFFYDQIEQIIYANIQMPNMRFKEEDKDAVCVTVCIKHRQKNIFYLQQLLPDSVGQLVRTESSIAECGRTERRFPLLLEASVVHFDFLLLI